jgi:hypothetical protein
MNTHSLKKSLSMEHARIARKAAYWQPKYDEWKKYGSFCPSFSISDIITDDLLQGYMDKGWNKITEIYKNKINNNNSGSPKSKVTHQFETHPVEQQELILNILGSIRKYIIHSTFKSVQKNINGDDFNELQAVGSENITSDYDVTILGPHANNIMWYMFISFLAKYEDSLPDAFDSNLYSSPLYIYNTKNTHDNIICKSIDFLPQRVNYASRFFTLVPYTDDDFYTELNWACVKILHLKSDIPPSLKKFVDNAKKYKKAMKSISINCNKDNEFKQVSLQNNLHPSNTINNFTRNIIRNYYLQWKYQKPIQKFIYSNDNKNTSFISNYITLSDNKSPETNLFFYSNIPNYFSSEAYYTSSSVNCVVINEQMKLKLNLENRPAKIKKGVYIIAAIENLGDLINHLYNSYYELDIDFELDPNKKINLIKTIVIKYSKYIYRIYDVLIKAGNDSLIPIANNILYKVLPFRRSYNIKKADNNDIFKFMYYDSNITFKNYILKLEKIILNHIHNSLEKII